MEAMSAAESAKTAAGAEIRAKRRIAGDVQGVGFRAATREAALRAGVRGWAKNESDGSVTALLLGSRAAVAEMDEFLRHGPPAARVTAVAKLMLDDEDEKADPQEFGIL